MKFYRTKCPSCGGELDVEEGLSMFFCKYCGTKILVDPNDPEQMLHEERMADKKLVSEKWDHMEMIVIFSIIGILFIVGFGAMIFLVSTK